MVNPVRDRNAGEAHFVAPAMNPPTRTKSVNLARLRLDVAMRRAERANGREGRQFTGAMAIVRSILPELERLRALGFTWGELAAGLADQGVTQIRGSRAVPIEGRRLSALVASVRRQDERRRMATEMRMKRSDLNSSRESMPPTTKRTFRLAPELQVSGPVPPDPTSGMTESELRRAALQSVKSILKETKR